MRILHVAESVKGGCGTYLNQVVRAQLAGSSVSDVRVVVPEAHALQIPDIPWDRRALFTGGSRSVASFAALWKVTARKVEAFTPDCIHLHSTFAGAIGRIGFAFRSARPPIVYCAHGWSFDMAGSPARRTAMAFAERLLSHACETVVAISDYERRRGIAAGIAEDRIVSVLNGMADIPPPPLPRTGGVRKLLFIGRLDRQKGIDLLLQAVDGLADRVELHIVGSAVVGDQTPIVDDRPGVTLLGWCDEASIREQLAWADCVVVPSRWEGFGLVAVEAMRAGRAVVATDVGGLPEVVAHGRTGWLVPPEDPTALRAQILSVTDEMLATAGAAGRRRYLERFTIERTIEGLDRVYRAAIAARRVVPAYA